MKIITVEDIQAAREALRSEHLAYDSVEMPSRALSDWLTTTPEGCAEVLFLMAQGPVILPACIVVGFELAYRVCEAKRLDEELAR